MVQARDIIFANLSGMEQITDYLKKLGLSELEAKIYLTLLQTGTVSIKSFAPMIGLKRTTAYLYIDPLIEKGLVVKVIQGNKKQIAAANPDMLQELVEKKVQLAKTQTKIAESVENEFPEILQTLNSTFLKKEEFQEAEIKYYKGKLGIQKIYEEALKAKELRSYVNIEEIATVFPDNFSMFDNAFKKNPNMQMFEIVEDSPRAKERIKTSSERKQYLYKFLPVGMKLSAQDILIYDNKVAIIQFKDKISGIVHNSVDLYNNFKLIFDLNWKILPEWK